MNNMNKLLVQDSRLTAREVGASGAPTAMAERPSHVSQSLTRLDSAITGIEMQVQSLVPRLAPIIRDEPSTPEADDKEGAMGTKLAEEIVMRARRLDELTRILVSVNLRIEL